MHKRVYIYMHVAYTEHIIYEDKSSIIRYRGMFSMNLISIGINISW